MPFADSGEFTSAFKSEGARWQPSWIGQSYDLASGDRIAVYWRGRCWNTLASPLAPFAPARGHFSYETLQNDVTQRTEMSFTGRGEFTDTFWLPSATYPAMECRTHHAPILSQTRAF